MIKAAQNAALVACEKKLRMNTPGNKSHALFIAWEARGTKSMRPRRA